MGLIEVLLEGFLRSISQGNSVLRVRKNTALYDQGDAADAVLYSGRMKLVVVCFGGKEATLSVVRPQEFWTGGFRRGRLATAVALEPATVTRAIVGMQPEITFAMVRMGLKPEGVAAALDLGGNSATVEKAFP